jgi:hypothetical protein
MKLHTSLRLSVSKASSDFSSASRLTTPGTTSSCSCSFSCSADSSIQVSSDSCFCASMPSSGPAVACGGSLKSQPFQFIDPSSTTPKTLFNKILKTGGAVFPAFAAGLVGLCWLGWAVSLHSPLGRLASAGLAGWFPCICRSVGWPLLSRLGRFLTYAAGSVGFCWLSWAVSLHLPLGRLASRTS